ncbi:MAG TPA: VCBS repeat-containing protein [Nocardioides sp.]|nr:VCBS repeat-containing protein [Nocardioides sp.]
MTGKSLGRTAEWTNNVEAADLDTDGDVDLLFANSGDERYWTPVENRVLLNRGDGTFTDATRRVFGKIEGTSRVIKVADLNADEVPDIVVGNIVSSQSRLYLGDGHRHWLDATASHLPAARLSVGDLELGDVDADGDLDIVLVDWGDGSPETNSGGEVTLWLNDGEGRFSDATAEQMPGRKVRFSWDLELVDVDNDWDLDIATSCKMCSSSLLYDNDGHGHFHDVSALRMPHYTNNYEFEPLDLDGDGYLDLVTINDGDATAHGLAEHVFRNDHHGGYVDSTARWWPPDANTGWDDSVAVGIDIESDRDVDFIVGSLDGPDRLLINDGTGVLTADDDIFAGSPSLGTLGLAVADLNGDGRPDVVEAQGEAPGHMDERMHLAGQRVPRDTAPPTVRAELVDGSVVARVSDNLTPNRPYDWRRIVESSAGRDRAMTWYGENLFRDPGSAGARDLEVCATDAAGNKTCAPVEFEGRFYATQQGKSALVRVR